MHAFCCLRCGAELGTTDGTTLRLQGAALCISSRAQVVCQCGARRVWRPVDMAAWHKERWERAPHFKLS